MPQAPIGAVARLFDIIETIQEQDGAGVSKLAEELGMAKSTIHGHLATLRRRGYLEQDADKRYHLSLDFLSLGGGVRQNRTIYRHVEPVLAEIASETGETVSYVVESGGDLTFVGSVPGSDGSRSEVEIGFRTDLHASPEGKLVLAYLPEDRRNELLDEVEFPLDNSVGRAAFTAKLDEIQAAAIAYGTETIVKNVATVAVPVIDTEDTFYGAVVVAGPALRFTDQHLDSVTKTLRSKIGKLNSNLAFKSEESTLEANVRSGISRD